MIAFVVGGTGGHVYPAIALAQEVGADKCLFIGSINRKDAEIVPKYGLYFASNQWRILYRWNFCI